MNKTNNKGMSEMACFRMFIPHSDESVARRSSRRRINLTKQRNGQDNLVRRVDACVYGIKLTQEIVIVNGENHGKFSLKPLNCCGKIITRQLAATKSANRESTLNGANKKPRAFA